MNTNFAVPRKLIDHLGCQKPSDILVYIAICGLASENASTVCVSTTALAGTTGLSRRTVFTAVARLEEAGLISRGKHGARGANLYEIIFGVPPVPLTKEVERSQEGERAEEVDPAEADENAEEDEDSEEDDGVESEPPLETQEREPWAEAPPDTSEILDAANETSVTKETMLEPIEHLIARVYRPGVEAKVLQRFIHCNDSRLRTCLEWMEGNMHLTYDAPIGVFTSGLLKALRQVC